VTALDIVVSGRMARFRGRRFPVTMGRSGTVQAQGKREGDGATPLGNHRIVGCLWRPDRVARPCDWAVPIRPGDLWCDDPGHEDYNLMVRAPFPASAERLRRADRLYDIVLVTDWNWPQAKRGRGSAIFVHAQRKPGYPTAGCVAFRLADLRWIVARIDYRTRLIVR